MKTNDAALIRLGAALLAAMLLVIAFGFMPLWAHMDNSFYDRYGCTPAEMAERVR